MGGFCCRRISQCRDQTPIPPRSRMIPHAIRHRPHQYNLRHLHISAPVGTAVLFKFVGYARKIQKSIAALQECGRSVEAFDLVTALHDLTEFDVPETIIGLEPFPDGIKMFMVEFIADTHDLMCNFVVEEFADSED